MTPPSAAAGAPLRSAVVTVGDELLLGRTVDTNSAWLGARLAELGAPVRATFSVGDEDDAIARALGQALERTAVVVLSGGLGPTADDRTRDGVAAHLGDAALAVAEALPNPVGTAPGLLLEPGEALVVLLPGVPRELRALFPAVADRVRARFGARLRPVHVRTLHTTGISESVLAPRVETALPRGGEVEVAFLPELTGVDVRLTVRDRDAAGAAAALDAAEARIAPALAPFRLPVPPEALPGLLLEALAERGWTLGLGESCTGGLIARRLTDVPGASRVLAGGVVAYADTAKTALLGVPTDLLAAHGAVSEPVAAALAEGAARVFGAHCGLGVTGVAGPGGGSELKPVGTVWMAATVGDRTRTRHAVFRGDREAVRVRAGQAALALLLELALELAADAAAAARESAR
ncbi:MAG: nicotinamide-nucleotide amidohydrolase family protein [Longimicrobiales bacterium]|nr:nicotinamide-nucleotide amidohydrolase family protein [Longimicrobiales bacterium]